MFVDANMSAAQLYECAGAMMAVYSARCPGKESANEDAAALIPFDERSMVLAVADGMGGGRAGDVASRLAIETLRDTLIEAKSEGRSMRAGILNGIERASAAIGERGVGAATTIVVVEFDDGVVRPYHVGDSMALVVGQRGKIKLQTVSHSPVGFAVEAGLLEEHEAMHHEDRHIVSNAVGAQDMRIEMGSSRKLGARDTLLLASDGLFDNLLMEEVVGRVRRGSLADAAYRLANDATRRMEGGEAGHPCKPDDLTFVLLRWGGRSGRDQAEGMS